MRQFHPSDTISWSPRFGGGGDGAKTVASNETYDGANAGLSGSYSVDPLILNPSLTIDAISTFANGQLVMIHQTRGAGAGNWELNKIKNGGGSLGLEMEYPLQNAYVDDGGANQAQIIQMKEFSALTVDAAQTYSGVGWDGNIGGILPIFVNGTATINGTISVSGAASSASNSLNSAGGGFRGGGGSSNGQSFQGESEVGVGGVSKLPNGSSGGGGVGQSGIAAGAFPAPSVYQTDPTLVTCFSFGGAGGGAGATGGTGQTGANSGGLVLLIAKVITVAGAIVTNGRDGANTGNNSAGSGGSGGGCILLKGPSITLGSGLVTSLGGASSTGGSGGGGGASGGSGATAGDASNGRAGGAGKAGTIHADSSLAVSGTTTPTITTTISELYADSYAHEGIFDSPKAALAQEKYKRQMKVAEI